MSTAKEHLTLKRIAKGKLEKALVALLIAHRFDLSGRYIEIDTTECDTDAGTFSGTFKIRDIPDDDEDADDD